MDEKENTTAQLYEENFAEVKKKKKPMFWIFPLFCFAISAMLTIIAIIVKDSVVNRILLSTGVLEIVVAFIIFAIALHRERYICSECGTKRIHHRTYLGTTEKVSTTNYNRINYPDGNIKTEYVHEYLDTYVCPKCGMRSERKVNKSGGEYIVFNDGRVLDRRLNPREF